MPTYSYRCTECSTAFDISQDFTDDSLTVCPSCEGRLRKVFSAVGVTFNGSGFYRTDSRAAAKGSEKSSSAESASSSSAKESTSSASKSSSSTSGSSSPSTSGGSSSSATPSKAAAAS